VLFVAMTGDNSVWRIPLLPDGMTAKVGRFASFHGTAGPDGMAVDSEGNLFVAHASLGTIFVLNLEAYEIATIFSCRGKATTNLAFGGEGKKSIFITESETGSILTAEWRISGLRQALRVATSRSELNTKPNKIGISSHGIVAIGRQIRSRR
jgi:gluconolactonase